MDASHLIALRTALANTLSGVLQDGYQISEPCSLTSSTTGHGVTGIVSYTGSLVGTLSLSMSLETAWRFAYQIDGLSIPEDINTLDETSKSIYEASIAETIAELVALIAHIPHADVHASCPTVVIGSGHRIAAMPETPTLQIRCDTQLGELTLNTTTRAITGSITASSTIAA